MHCQYCGEINKEENLYCKRCGKELERVEYDENAKRETRRKGSETMQCKKCSTPLDGTDSFYPQCGKKLVLGIVGLVLAVGIVSGIFIGMDDREEAKAAQVKHNQNESVEVKPFDEAVFMQDIRVHIDCLASCVSGKYGIKESEESYMAMYTNEEDVHEQKIAKMVLGSASSDSVEAGYVADMTAMKFTRVENFDKKEDVYNHLKNYLSEDVLETWYQDVFVEFDGELYYKYGSNGNIQSCDSNTYQYVEEKNGKRYVMLDFTLGEEYDYSSLLEFSWMNDRWVISAEKKLEIDDVRTLASEGNVAFPAKRLYAPILKEYQDAEESGFEEIDYATYYENVNPTLFEFPEQEPLQYVFKDMCNDGIPELFIVQNKGDGMLKHAILDIYTHSEDGITRASIQDEDMSVRSIDRVGVIGDHNQYYFTKDNCILNVVWQNGLCHWIDCFYFDAETNYLVSKEHMGINTTIDDVEPTYKHWTADGGETEATFEDYEDVYNKYNIETDIETNNIWEFQADS